MLGAQLPGEHLNLNLTEGQHLVLTDMVMVWLEGPNAICEDPAMTTNSARAYSYLRFSTPEQMKGDSFRRQVELSRAYAIQHKLDLDESLTFRDLGVSAFRGRNVKEGSLGDFIKAVETGRVLPGSYLLVESLDRLSRDKVQLAFRQFSAILESGVNIVTLTDGKVYTTDSLNENFADLLISLATMFRAHEESLTKSKRLKAAWKDKRDMARAGGRKLTAMCPGWLRLDKDTGEYVVIEDRVEIIRRIFDMAINGLGADVISRQFHMEGISPFGRSSRWHPSYIQKVLNNEAVIGTFQPMRHEIRPDGKRGNIPDGEPIDDYFPAVIATEDFLRAKQMRKDRRIGSGRKGNKFSNLFTRLAVCGSCGATMVYAGKGEGYVYLVCRNAKQGRDGCKYHSWRYRNTELFILIGLQEVQYEDLFPSLNAAAKETIAQLDKELVLTQGALDKAKTDLETTVGLLVDRPDSAALKTKLDQLEADQDRLERQLEEVQTRLSSERATLADAKENHGETLSVLAEWLREAWIDEGLSFERRSRLHQLIKRTVERIALTPGADDCHGDITIDFRGVSDFKRVIRVAKGQTRAESLRIDNGDEEAHGTVIEVFKGRPPPLEKPPWL
jgi:DNA invertase Pin-like site-specific DNA recombinase